MQKYGLHVSICKYKGNPDFLLFINKSWLLFEYASVSNITLIRNQKKARKWAFDPMRKYSFVLTEYVACDPLAEDVIS